jgi:hypothetical protein
MTLHPYWQRFYPPEGFMYPLKARYLQNLADTWMLRARIKFRDAKLEDDPMGQRLIRHGAICYFNCAMDIKRLLGETEDVPCNQAFEIFHEDVECP